MAIEKQGEISSRGLACIQTDNTVHVGNDRFIALENNSKQRFDSKNEECLSKNNELKLNGSIVREDGNTITISQAQHIAKLRYLNPCVFSKEQFVTEHARRAYISAVFQRDCTYMFSKLSQAM